MPLVNDSNLSTIPLASTTQGYNPLNQIMSLFGDFQNMPQGSNAPMLRNEFLNMLKGMTLPGRQDMESMARRNITTQTRRDIRGLNEGLAARGTLGAGAGANAIAELLRGQSNALSDVETNLNQMQTQYNQQNRGVALQGLMGLDQQQQSLFNNLLQGQLGLSNLDLQRYLGMENIRLKERELDQSESGFFDVVGGLLGIGAGALTGGLGAGLAGSLFGDSNG